MVRQQKIDNSLRERIDDSLSSPGSQNEPSPSADTASELVAALDNLLLEKAAEELRAGELVFALDSLLLEKAAEEPRADERVVALNSLSLEKAAEELRVAQAHVNKFKRELGKD